MIRTRSTLVFSQPGCIFRPLDDTPHSFSSFSPALTCHPSRPTEATRSKKSCHNQGSRAIPASEPLSSLRLPFGTCRSTWKRAGINTLRCLVGCTVGDFSALWMLQTYFSELGMGTIMAASMATGVSISIILETALLKHGADQLSWPVAARTATGMSLVSMLAMEVVENMVDYHLTGGVVAAQESRFWLAAALSTGAGFLVPLPYNYLRLQKYGKACH